MSLHVFVVDLREVQFQKKVVRWDNRCTVTKFCKDDLS